MKASCHAAGSRSCSPRSRAALRSVRASNTHRHGFHRALRAGCARRRSPPELRMNETTSFWMRTPPALPALPAMAARISTAIEDVVVVGAGIAGLSVALALLERGRRVLVVDRDA